MKTGTARKEKSVRREEKTKSGGRERREDAKERRRATHFQRCTSRSRSD